MKLITKLGIYALVFASCFSLQAKEDALLETQRNQAETAVQQIRDIENGNTDAIKNGREFTHLLMEASKNYNLLSPASKALMKKYGELPEGFSNSHLSSDGYFKIYFKYDGEDAVPEADLNENGVPDLIEDYARWMVDARKKYIDFGLKMPHSNANYSNQYNIYIANSLCREGVYGYTSPLEPWLMSSRSYVVLRSDYSDFGGFGKPLGFTDSVAAQITGAHEFQHSIQMAYAYPNMSMFLMEGCAVWSEQFVYEGQQDPFSYIQNFLTMSNLGVNYDPRAEYNPTGNNGNHYLYPYGSWVFFKYLTDMYGNDIVRELYEKLAKENRKEVAAFDLALAVHGTSFTEATKNFYTSMISYPSDPSTKPIYFSRGDEILNSKKVPLVTPNYTYEIKSPQIVNVNTKTNNWATEKKIFNRMGSHYYRLIPDRGATIELTPAGNYDSLVLIVYQYKKTGGNHNLFKVSEVKAFGNKKVSLSYVYDPVLPDVYVQLYNNKTYYNKVTTSWDLNNSTTFYELNIIPDAEVGVEENILPNDFSIDNIHPMPATDNAVMNLSIGTPALMTYKIFDASGRTVSNNSFFANPGQMKYDLNLNGLTAGVYFLEVTNGVKSEKINFIVK